MVVAHAEVNVLHWLEIKLNENKVEKFMFSFFNLNWIQVGSPLDLAIRMEG